MSAPVRGDLPAPTHMLEGSTVYRVVWQLHTDVLVGYCWCGVSHDAVDPIELWDWLLGHPATHDDGSPDEAVPEPAAPIGVLVPQ